MHSSILHTNLTLEVVTVFSSFGLLGTLESTPTAHSTVGLSILYSALLLYLYPSRSGDAPCVVWHILQQCNTLSDALLVVMIASVSGMKHYSVLHGMQHFDSRILIFAEHLRS